MLSSNFTPSLYLDYGADEQSCGHEDLEISERGMRFLSRWHFDIGTQIAVSLVRPCAVHGACRVKLEGIVVWCEPRDGKCFESTLLFPELPDELKPSLREFSHLLAGT